MSEQRDKLVSRFRATLAGRVRACEAALAGHAPDAGEILRHELHTLKGESRMLGLSALSNLAHELEERLVDWRGTKSEEAKAMLEVVQIARRVLESNAAPPEIDAKCQALLRHGEERDDSISASSPGAPALSLQRWTQVDASVVDRLCRQLTELHALFTGLGRSGAPAQASLDGVDACRGVLEECTATAWELRLVPVRPMLEQLERHAQKLAADAGKPLTVKLEGGEIQLESDVLDQVWECLLHLVNNAVEHGARGEERTRLVIRAEPRTGSVLLSVSDDGKGIDPAAVRQAAKRRGASTLEVDALSDAQVLELLFDSGFSTRESVGTLSGRGVGLDVVRSRVEQLGGSVGVESTPGEGTRFSLRVPLLVTRQRMMVFGVGSSLFGLPVDLVRSVVHIDADSRIEAGRPRLRYLSELIPLRSLPELLGVREEREQSLALVLEISGRLSALAVASVLGERELIRTQADPLLLQNGLLAATSLLDDGRLVLFPQLGKLSALIQNEAQGLPRAMAEPRQERLPRVLVADDSLVVRDLLAELLVLAGVDVTLATDGAEALAALERQAPDLVLSDVEMPNLDGFALLEAIRRRDQRLPVVMLTTRGSVEDRQRAAALGANAYLVKSEFESGALMDTLARFIRVRA